LFTEKLFIFHTYIKKQFQFPVLMSKKQKMPIKNSERPVEFCMECGEQLAEFDFKYSDKDADKVRKQVRKCSRSKRLTGDMCSRYFISSDHGFDELLRDKDE